MKVNPFVLSGDLYEYENVTGTVLKSDYGVFFFSEDEDEDGLGQFEGRIKPYQVDLFDGESLKEEDVSLDAYCTEEDILVPLYEVTDLEPSRVFVIDGEIAVRIGGLVTADPQVIGGEQDIQKFVKVYPTAFDNSHWRTNHPEFVERTDLVEVFSESTVERVSVV